MNKDELADELSVSCNKYMTCSICELEIGYNRENDEELMYQHFKEEHNYKEND